MMDGDFFVGAALATTLTKLALKYINNTPDVKRQNVICFLRKLFINIIFVLSTMDFDVLI